MKRMISVLLMIALASSLPAESVMSGLFGAADEVSVDVSQIVSGDGVLLIGGVDYNQTSVKLGDLFADLTANRLAGRNGFRPDVVKQYANLGFSRGEESWTLSGNLYDAGAGYLLTLQLMDAQRGSQLKGWEYALGRDGIDELLRPSVLQGSGGAWDAYESNNSAAEAYVIQPPFDVSDLALGDGDEDWFAVEVPATRGGNVMVLQAATSGALDTYMELYSPDDQSWAVTEDDDTDGGNAMIQYPISEPGTWYVKVRGYSDDVEGSYGLTVSLREDTLGPGEPDEGPEGATSLNVGTSPLSKNIDYSSDEDWFRLRLVRPLGRDEVLRIETMGDMDLVMELMDEYQGYIMEDDDSGNMNNPMVIVSGLDAGEYYVVVSGYGGETGSYDIMANIAVPVRDSFEPDDDMSQASGIETNTAPQRRTFSPPGDVDWVRFEVSSPGNYRIRTQGEIDTYMELYDESGVMIAENDDGENYNAMIEYRLDRGTFYISVSPYGAANPDEVYELIVNSLN
ncbi:MAG: PPC domain-containing protein [Spirochaetaceae bacterium]|nr:PPC domain-containing protein [Spirochaetaceae bacterium]